jgi:hypothetical protein
MDHRDRKQHGAIGWLLSIPVVHPHRAPACGRRPGASRSLRPLRVFRDSGWHSGQRRQSGATLTVWRSSLLLFRGPIGSVTVYFVCVSASRRWQEQFIARTEHSDF